MAVITREQRETRGVLVAGQVAGRLGIKEGHFNQVVCKEKKTFVSAVGDIITLLFSVFQQFLLFLCHC